MQIVTNNLPVSFKEITSFLFIRHLLRISLRPGVILFRFGFRRWLHAGRSTVGFGLLVTLCRRVLRLSSTCRISSLCAGSPFALAFASGLRWLWLKIGPVGAHFATIIIPRSTVHMLRRSPGVRTRVASLLVILHALRRYRRLVGGLELIRILLATLG